MPRSIEYGRRGTRSTPSVPEALESYTSTPQRSNVRARPAQGAADSSPFSNSAATRHRRGETPSNPQIQQRHANVDYDKMSDNMRDPHPPGRRSLRYSPRLRSRGGRAVAIDEDEVSPSEIAESRRSSRCHGPGETFDIGRYDDGQREAYHMDEDEEVDDDDGDDEEGQCDAVGRDGFGKIQGHQILASPLRDNSPQNDPEIRTFTRRKQHYASSKTRLPGTPAVSVRDGKQVLDSSSFPLDHQEEMQSKSGAGRISIHGGPDFERVSLDGDHTADMKNVNPLKSVGRFSGYFGGEASAAPTPHPGTFASICRSVWPLPSPPVSPVGREMGDAMAGPSASTSRNLIRQNASRHGVDVHRHQPSLSSLLKAWGRKLFGSLLQHKRVTIWVLVAIFSCGMLHLSWTGLSLQLWQWRSKKDKVASVEADVYSGVTGPFNNGTILSGGDGRDGAPAQTPTLESRLTRELDEVQRRLDEMQSVVARIVERQRKDADRAAKGMEGESQLVPILHSEVNTLQEKMQKVAGENAELSQKLVKTSSTLETMNAQFAESLSGLRSEVTTLTEAKSQAKPLMLGCEEAWGCDGKEDFIAGHIEKALTRLGNHRALAEEEQKKPPVPAAFEKVNIERMSQRLDELYTHLLMDGTGQVDWALQSLGSRIVHSETSPAINTELMYEWLLHAVSTALPSDWNLGATKPMGKPPEIVLQPDVHPGQCFAFSGQAGRITIQLTTAVLVRTVVIEMVSPELNIRKGSVPRDFSVTGFADSRRFRVSEDIVAAQEPSSGKDGAVLLSELRQLVSQAPPSSSQEIHLGDFTGSADVRLQSFRVKPTVPLRRIRFSFKSNHGAGYTCIYRLRVHGVKPEPVDGRGEGSASSDSSSS